MVDYDKLITYGTMVYKVYNWDPWHHFKKRLCIVSCKICSIQENNKYKIKLLNLATISNENFMYKKQEP